MGCLPLWTALEESGAVCQDLISFEKKNKKKITLFFFFSLWLENAVLVFYRHSLCSVITKCPERSHSFICTDKSKLVLYEIIFPMCLD